jgi:hypothetical protein
VRSKNSIPQPYHCICFLVLLGNGSDLCGVWLHMASLFGDCLGTLFHLGDVVSGVLVAGQSLQLTTQADHQVCQMVSTYSDVCKGDF